MNGSRYLLFLYLNTKRFSVIISCLASAWFLSSGSLNLLLSLFVSPENFHARVVPSSVSQLGLCFCFEQLQQIHFAIWSRLLTMYLLASWSFSFLTRLPFELLFRLLLKQHLHERSSTRIHGAWGRRKDRQGWVCLCENLSSLGKYRSL